MNAVFPPTSFQIINIVNSDLSEIEVRIMFHLKRQGIRQYFPQNLKTLTKILIFYGKQNWENILEERKENCIQ